ncbi:uncharacterized protein ACNLHF_014024 [Anomaloglossus baeobatrachus]
MTAAFKRLTVNLRMLEADPGCVTKLLSARYGVGSAYPSIIQNLHVSAVSSVSATILWTQPLSGPANYTVTVIGDPSSQSSLDSITSLDLIYLIPGNYYTVVVSANDVPFTINFYTEPDVVKNLMTVIITTTSISLSWDKPDGNASSYEIQILGNPTFNKTGTTTSDTIEGLTPGNYYTLLVTAVVGENNVTGNSSEISVYTKPEVVKNLMTGIITTTSISLIWDKPDGNASSYEIQILGDPSFNETVTSTSDTIEGLTPGNYYTLLVTAVVGENNVTGNSSEISVYTKPDLVKNLMPGIITTTSISLSWEKPDGNASSYEVQILGDPTFNKTVTSTSDTIEGLTPGNYYTLLVTAVVGENNVTGNSSEISVYTKPQIVKNLSTGIITTTSISLSWEKPDGNASSYVIQILGDPTFNKTVTSTSVTIEGLTPGNYHTLLVTAVVGENNVTRNSSEISVYTKPEVVKNLMPGVITTTSISLSWEKPDGNTSSYYIQILGDPTFNKTVTSTSDTIEGLTPGNYYTLLVTAVVGENNMITTTSISLIWEKPDGNTSSYIIQILGDPTFNKTVTTNSDTIDGLTPGNYYTLLVTAVVGENNVTGNSSEIFLYTKPEIVKNLKPGIITTTSISLSWEKPDGNASSYEIQILGDPTFNKNVTSTSDTIEGLTPGNYYTLLVTAVVGENNVTGNNSEISVYTKPEVVKNLSTGIITTTSISLSWETPDGNASSYVIQILGDPTFNKTVTSTSDTIEGLTPGNYYTLLVTAVVGENNVTGNSSEISVYTSSTLLMTGNITTTSISLSWEKPVGNASSYVIQILGYKTFNKTVSSTSNTIDGLTPGNYYTFLVMAVVGENNVIGNSSEISIYTKPEVVKNLMTGIITTTSISLSWEKPDGNASSYEIQILGDPTFNKTVTSTSDAIDGLTPGNYYTLLVTAVVGENNVTGNSSAISVYAKPEVVKNLMPGVMTTTSIPLSWEKPDGNTSSYEIQVLGDPSFNKTVTSISDTIDGLTPGNYYTLLVTAVVGENNMTGNSSEISLYTKPDVVKNLMPGIITNTSISLSWEKPDGNTSYYYIQILGDQTFNKTVTSTFDTIDGLTPGNYYTLLVTAVVGENNMTGNRSEISLYTKPDVVKNLMPGIITNTSISLSWEKPDGYASYYYIQILGDPTFNKSVTSTSETIDGLTPGNYYTLLVTAVVGENNVTGNSSEISVYTEPDVVKNLMPGIITTTSISLSWGKPDGNTSFYYIQILGDPTFNKTVTSTSDTIEGLTPGNYYTLLVTAVVGENNMTGNSSELSLYTKPDVVKNLMPGIITTTSISLSWDKPDGNTSYYYIQILGDPTFNKTVTSTSDTIEGLTPGNYYTLLVTAVVGENNVTGNSSEISVYTEPDVVKNLISGIITTTSISLSWEKPDGNASSYEIQILGDPTFNKTGTSTSDTIVGLTPGNYYTLLVTAVVGENNVTGNSLEISVYTTCDLRDMDFRARDQSWLCQINEVFKEDSSGCFNMNHKDHSTQTNHLKTLLHRRIRTWWNKGFLEKYVTRGLIPRGLRIQVFPSFSVEDEWFRRGWEESANLCSKKFMELLIKLNEQTIQELENEIESVQDILKKELSSAEWVKLNADIEVDLTKWEGELKSVKTKKFQRDVTDQQNNQIYRWRSKKFPLYHKNRSRSQSFSSVTSGEGSDTEGSRTGLSLFNSYRGGPKDTSKINKGKGPAKRKNISPGAAQETKRKQGQPEVINLSSRVLSEAQKQVLQLGLTFVPSKSFDYFTAVKDLFLFSRKLILRKLHCRREEPGVCLTEEEQEAIHTLEELLSEQTTDPVPRFPMTLLPRSLTFPPLSVCSQIEIFTKLVMEDFGGIPRFTHGDNLSNCQRKAMGELREMRDIVIKNADKGGNVVIWPVNLYEREAFRQLNNKTTYSRLSHNPIPEFNLELQEILDRACIRGTIPKKVMDGLFVKHPRTPTFYLLPKVHKDATNPPGRPIVSGIGGICDPICKFVDFYLKPLVQDLPSYIRDTTDALAKMEGLHIEPDMWLVAADVESLYTCIAHQDGLEAVRLFLDGSRLDGPTRGLILELLDFILTHNAFLFKDRYYLQRRGTAMGAACAPSYANLFLGMWERGLFHEDDLFSQHVICWHRYIDDVLFLWQGAASLLDEFMIYLNRNNLNIKLTYVASQKQLDFLDIHFEVGADGALHTDIHRKETSVNSLLHASSAHTRSTIRAVPTGQFLRARRVCSTDQSFESESQNLRVRFQQRGYSNRNIKRGYLRARHTPREQLLYSATSTKKDKNKGNEIRYISTFNCQWDKMRECLKRHWAILKTDRTLSQSVSENPLMTPRRGRNLRDILVDSHYVAPVSNPFLLNEPVKRKGCFVCGECLACREHNLIPGSDFRSADGSKYFKIQKYITCKSSFVIYLATCPCPKLYVGLTSRQLRTRTREHVRDIRNSKQVVDDTTLRTIPRHFKTFHGCDASGLKLKEPDVVKNLMAEDITTTSISLSWEKPDGNASSYEIQILGHPTFNESMTSTFYTIEGLTPGNYYTLLVTAVVGEKNVTGNSSEISVYTKPDVVKNLMAEDITTTSISLSWEKPDGNASSYVIQIFGDPTFNKTVASTSDTIEGLTPGNYYTLLVTAVVGENNVTGNSSEISVYTKPEQVKNLTTGIITTTSISLSWEKPDGNTNSYEIQILGDPTFNKTVTSTSDTIEGLTPGNYYTLLVTAVVGKNNVTGNSSEISMYTKPEVVKNLMAEDITTTFISLSWEKPDGNASSYEIQILGDPTFNESITSTFYTIEGLTPGNYYTLLVTAVVGENNVTGNSSEISLYTKPELVKNLSTGIITTTSISLIWEKPDGNASSYEIQILGNPTFNKTVTSTSDTIEGLTPGNYYTLLVTAVVAENNVAGNSSAISVYTKPDVVKNLMAEDITPTSISLSWEKPDGNASSYEIQILGDLTFNESMTSTFYTIEGLTPGNYYTLLVTAVVGENNVTGNSSKISLYTKPDLVKNLMSGIITTTSISLSWEKPDGNASSYEIQILGDPTFNKTVMSISHTIDGLTPGNYYTLLVTAIIGENNVTGNSSEISVNTKPDVVKNIMTGIITTTSISLSWLKPDGNASSYEIQILGDPTFNKTVNSTSETIEGLTPGNYYTLLVTAVVGENSVSGNSSEISVYTKPDVVKNLMAKDITTTSISLSWEKPDGNASSYEIQFLGDPTFNESTTSTFYTIEGLTSGNYYTLLVTAVVGENNVTGNSSEISLYTKPELVKNLMTQIITTTSISLSWGKPDGNISSYEIQILGDPTFNKTVATTSDTIEGLTPGNYYTLLVSAVVGENNLTGNSSEIFVYTKPEVVKNLMPGIITTTSISLSWEKPDGNASFYEIQILGDSSFNKTVTSTSDIIDGLTPGNYYTLLVTAVVGENNVTGNSSEISVYTSEYSLC